MMMRAGAARAVVGEGGEQQRGKDEAESHGAGH